MKDEFYIGYRDECPAGLASRLRRWTTGMGFGFVLLAAVAAVFQKPAEPGVFEFGVRRTVVGILGDGPLPILRTVSEQGGVQSFLLVGTGKSGPPPNILAWHGQWVRIQGSLIRKGNVAMLEVASVDRAETPVKAAGLVHQPRIEVVGPVELTGELVDTKCHLGVMRPGEGKVHRGCAVRCLSGGVPPGLWVSTPDGGSTVVLLEAAEGSGWRVNPEWAARTVRMHGLLSLHDGLPVLAVRQHALVNDR